MSACSQSKAGSQAHLQGDKFINFKYLIRVLRDHGSPVWDDKNDGRESGGLVSGSRQW